MTPQTEPFGNRTAREVTCVERPLSLDELDAVRYFQANPDVARSGVSAATHFTRYGQKEGRIQYANADKVATMREEKLARLRFRRPPPRVSRAKGQPIDFLTPALVTEFEIPDAPPVSANQYGGPFIQEIAANPQRLCLDIGADLRYSYTENIVNTEIYSTISTDVLCVGEDLPFADAQFDYVICAAVLEHTRRPWDVAREICRVLKPGGRVLIDWPFLQGVHGYPHHYYNATPQGLISLFSDQCDVVSSTIEPNNHPMHAIWWILQIWQHGLAEPERKEFSRLTIEKLLATSIDQHLVEPYCVMLSEEAARIIPAGSTLIAERRHDPVVPAARPVDDAVSSNADTTREAQLVALEAEVALLRASRSWRLTAPLRAIRARLQRR